jgi:hypothetical protein
MAQALKPAAPDIWTGEHDPIASMDDRPAMLPFVITLTD